MADRQSGAPDGPRATEPVLPRRCRTWRWVAAVGVLVLAAAVTAVGGVTSSLGLPDPPGRGGDGGWVVWVANPEGNAGVPFYL